MPCATCAHVIYHDFSKYICTFSFPSGYSCQEFISHYEQQDRSVCGNCNYHREILQQCTLFGVKVNRYHTSCTQFRKKICDLDIYIKPLPKKATESKTEKDEMSEVDLTEMQNRQAITLTLFEVN